MPTPPLRLKLPLAEAPKPGGDLPPALTRPTSRAGGPALPVVPGVKVVTSWTLATTARGEAPPRQADTAADAKLLALEAADGTTVFIRADKLSEDLARLRPELVEADGSIDLAGFRDEEGASRGLGDWLWRKVHELAVEDNIEDLARGKVQDLLLDKAVEKLTAEKVLQCSTPGAKALMQAIEEKLAGEPGLYQWKGGAVGAGERCGKGDPRLGAWGGQPALVFIHGTGSSTLGGFKDMRSGPDWEALTRIFEDRIFGFEHRTFSLSPIDNALALAEVLPPGANLCLVTHSRGGLVGDLMCLGGYTPDAQGLVDDFRRQPRPDEAQAETADTSGGLRTLREQVAGQEQAKLRQLYALLAERKFVIRRYVRVAAPAAGTALLSDNLEVFLSGLLDLASKAFSWGAGAAAGAATGGLAAAAVETAVSQGLGFLSRVVLEIARQRLQPQFVPGIEAMLPESPLGSFLARAGRRSDVAMAVIAGDIEGGGMVKRIGVMFTDWMFFDRADNDLVVDTSSMYAGLAREGAHALFDQGPEVSHFHYFKNPRTRGALRSWLVEPDPLRLPEWTPMASLLEVQAAAARSDAPPPPDNTRPVVIYLPGIMGSNLEVGRSDPDRPGSGDRVWLDFLDLAGGGLKKIAFDQPKVAPDDVVALAYGRLATYLEKNHRVIRYAYDWRQSNLQHGLELAKVLEQALKDHPDQPVRILAHSMGGLVSRAMIQARPDLWEEVVKREGGRLVFLGTPHHGSHLMVETLLGKSDTMRMLARLDLAHGLQAVLDIVAGYPGALQLLPQPGFEDEGGPPEEPRNWQDAGVWPGLAEINNDFWFGKKLGGKPRQDDLQLATAQWAALDGGKPGDAAPIPHPERIAYVYGQAENTPCGMAIQKDGQGRPTAVAMLGTPRGDGSVSWASGRLSWLPEDRYWLLPAGHSGMVNTPDYFPDIDELLATGRSSRLGRVPVSRGAGEAPPKRYNAAPMPGYPSEQELVAAAVGGRARAPRPKAIKTSMAVSVRAADLRTLQVPVLCGHYLEDPIAGAERVIDQSLVDGALSQRVRLGVHAGPRGSASVVLMPRKQEEVLRGTGKGALVVGLGQFGELSANDITDTVRAGVLRLLLHAADRQTEQPGASREPAALRLASVLIGYNSTTHISVDESVAAITLGVLEANQQFGQGTPAGRPGARVACLEFVELYQDVALTAARAVAALGSTLERQAKALGTSLEAARELIYGEGVRQRLSVSPGAHYWPRLIVTDADRSEDACSPECYRTRVVSSIPPDVVDELLARHGCGKGGGGEAPAAPPGSPPPAAPKPAPATRYPQRLRFLFLSERARAETVVQQRQPGLVEKLVAAETRNTSYSPEVGIGRTLFHLLVPLDFKAAAREAANLLLVVDGASANLPWEMLVADGEPMVRSTRVVRQLASSRFRPTPRGTRQLSAYVVRNPSTQGYYAEFGGKRPPRPPEEDHLPDLPGADGEGQLIAGLLEGAGYEVIEATHESEAADVIGKLYRQPYRIVVIAAHGMFQVADRQGELRSGVVLSDGIFLTAAEVGQMENVPELVFLSCCNLGKADVDAGYAPNRLAYSLARELIEMGVRCVVAAGWEVDDAAARTFSATFFERFVGHGESFGNALFEARNACFEGHRDRNTWGAYQAYGDPAFTLGERPAGASEDEGALLAPVELVDWLERLRGDACRGLPAGARKDRYDKTAARIRRRLRDLPPAWTARPDVQQALAALYAEFGEEGFEAARAAYQAAISADSTTGVVSLAAVEQLANLEARTAAKLADPKAALERIEQAIARLEHLRQLTAGPASVPNTERACLLGSAYKRKAEFLAKAGKGWGAVEKALGAARDAYVRGEANPASPLFAPYATLNRLQLDAVLGQAPKGWEALVEQCKAAARRGFEQKFDFWNAVMPADAEVARRLLEGQLDPGQMPELATLYRDAVGQVAVSDRQLDSVVGQLRLMAAFLALGGRAKEAQALEQLAAELGGGAAPEEQPKRARKTPKQGGDKATKA